MKQFFINFSHILKKVDSFFKKAFLILIVFVTIISLFIYFFTKNQPTQVKDPIKEQRDKIYAVINDPKLKATEDGRTQIKVYRSVTCSLMGEACTDDPDDGNKNFDQSVFGFMSNLIVMPYATPISSGVGWVHDGLANAGFVPKTYAAQGIGFNALAPFQGIWLMFRNFIFMIMVLIIVAIGFMIMFRMKLNPQTVISIESALPKIVISLILVTFSYPIAGFLIDLTYVAIGFIIVLFSSANSSLFHAPDLFNKYFFGGTDALRTDFTPFDWDRDKFIWAVSSNIYEVLPNFLKTILNVITLVLGEKLAFALLGKKFPSFNLIRLVRDVSDQTKTAAQPIVSLIAAVILILINILLHDIFGRYLTIFLLTFILGLSLLFIYFRIFFMILSSYLNILFLVIFSPLIIAIEAIPGKSTFSHWLKSMISHLMTFPILIALVLIVQVILNTGTTGSVLWRPPYFFGLDPDAFKALVAAGILFMIPDLIKNFKELLGFKPFPISMGIGSVFTGAQAIGSGGMGIMGQISSMNLALNAFGSSGFLGGIIRGKKAPSEPSGVASETARQSQASARVVSSTDTEASGH